MHLPAPTRDPTTGVVTLTTGDDMTIEHVAHMMDMLRHILREQHEQGLPVRMLFDARRKSFRDLRAQRALSQGFRDLLEDVAVAKLALVRLENDYAHAVLAASDPRMHCFRDMARAYAWLSGV